MSTKPPSNKSHLALLSEIDALCAEIDEAALDAEVGQAKSIQEVTVAQEARDRKKRLHRYAQVADTALVEVEIAPYDSPRDRASMVIKGSFGVLYESAEVSECFGLVEYLLSKAFSVTATGKYLAPVKAHEDARSVTWFVLQR